MASDVTIPSRIAPGLLGIDRDELADAINKTTARLGRDCNIAAELAQPGVLHSTVSPLSVSLIHAVLGYVADEHVEPVTSTDAPWPTCDEAAFHGVIGAYALDAAPHTEADPIGVLISTLAGVGALIGAGPYGFVGNTKHRPLIWPVLVGATSKGGKGTAWAVAQAALEHADPFFFGADRKRRRLRSGFQSGEVLIDAVRDGDPDDDNDKGVDDKRLLVLETEFARHLKLMGRENSTLEQVVREAWEATRPLETNARVKKAYASGYHIALMGHVTVEELRLRMTDSAAYGGTANRFLWVCVRRARRLSEGGNVPENLARKHGETIHQALTETRSVGLMKRTDAGQQAWDPIYNEYADDEPGGLLGAAVARDAAQTLRLSMLYALLDGQRDIDVDHVHAAHALWNYCRASAAHIWGNATGNSDTDRLLAAVRTAGPQGLDGKQQHEVFGRNITADRLDAARRALINAGHVNEQSIPSGGRPRRVLVLSSLVRVHSSPNGTHSETQ